MTELDGQAGLGRKVDDQVFDLSLSLSVIGRRYPSPGGGGRSPQDTFHSPNVGNQSIDLLKRQT